MQSIAPALPKIVKALALPLAVFVLCTCALPAAYAQTFKLSGESYEVTWPKGDWSGRHSFRDLYCVNFPAPKTAGKMVHAMFNNGTIYLTTVMYPDNLNMAVAVSSLPAGSTAEADIRKFVERERALEKAHETSYNITQLTTKFGPAIGLRIRNVAPSGPEGPFPLERAQYAAPRQPFQTLSVYRIFVRGADRFDVAVLQMAPQLVTGSTERAMTADLTRKADELVASLQDCTAALPLLKP